MVGRATIVGSDCGTGFGGAGGFAGNALGPAAFGLAVSTSFKGCLTAGGATGAATGADGSGCRATKAGFGVLNESDIVGEGRTAVIVEAPALTMAGRGAAIGFGFSFCFRGCVLNLPLCVKCNLPYRVLVVAWLVPGPVTYLSKTFDLPEPRILDHQDHLVNCVI